MPTKRRTAKVEKVLSLRIPDLHVVLEEVTNTHNASAVFRTCDAAGVLHVDLIYRESSDFPVNEAISTRAEKWLSLTRYSSTEACLTGLKEKGFTIAATHLSPKALPYTDVDFTRPTAIVFGNESDGISEEALALSDLAVQIPMVGMAQSLNLSVSVGIFLYEALRQRRAAGYHPALSPDEFKRLRTKWLGLDP
jgi:tRNA (guanosine-2'-O-)-methyltransferase